MNKFSIYQYLIIFIVLAVGSFYALPNLYPTQPSIQVAYTDTAKSADQALLVELEEILELANKEHLEEIGMLKKNIETSSLESINLRKRIENLAKIKSRMKTLFTDISAQFRENICSLFGYNVSVH